MKRDLSRFFLLGGIILISLTGCRTLTHDNSSEADPSTTSDSASFADRKLLRLIEEGQLLRVDAETADPDEWDVKRRFQELARAYESFIADNPDRIEGHLLHGKLLAYFGDRAGAMISFRKALTIDPNIAVAHQQIGNTFAEEGDPTRALAYFLRAIDLEPDVAEYHYSLGECLSLYRAELVRDEVYTEEAVDAAILESFAKAAELAPNSLILQFRFGEASYDVKNPDWERVSAHWKKLSQHPDLNPLQSDVVRLHRARSELELSHFEEVRKLLEAPVQKGLKTTRQSLLEKLNPIPESRRGSVD